MKKLLLCLSVAFFAVNMQSQNTLSFSRALVVSALDQVPSGKVWKITSVYGSEFRVNRCVDLSVNSTDEMAGARCGWVASGYSMPTNSSKIATYEITSFKVNGKTISSRVLASGVNMQSMYNSTSNCTGGQGNYGSTVYWTCASYGSDPNILPMWLPAGTTLETGGSNTFLSVLEFTVE
ncbi:MAG: hypothetical protein IT223_11080 [Crocinitomicaceae bacterium]|nr:hypothetical protein [Crocinitomicaceae bacterium]